MAFKQLANVNPPIPPPQINIGDDLFIWVFAKK